METENRVVSATRTIAAPAETVFELIADPRRQPEWDGNDNLVEVITGDRIRAAGEVFAMRTTKGNHRDNLVTGFEEGRRIAWRPGNAGEAPAGHEWRWEVEPVDDEHVAGHPHLRLDRAHGRGAYAACARHAGAAAPCVARPARRARRVAVA